MTGGQNHPVLPISHPLTLSPSHLAILSSYQRFKGPMFTQYILRRILWTLLTLVGVSVLTFVLVFAGPTDPARKLVGDKATGVSIEAIRKEYGLDKPLYVQYLTYMGH